MSNVIYTPFLSYLRIVAEAQEGMLRYSEEPKDSSLDSSSFPRTINGQATIVVLFTAIALECYISNYATRKLGELFCKRHIESMGHQTKWLLVPKLATGRAIPPDHRGVERLRKLIAARNKIAHAKAINVDPEQWKEQKSKIIASDRSVVNAACEAFLTVGDLGSALQVVDPEEPSASLLAEFLKSPVFSVRSKSGE